MSVVFSVNLSCGKLPYEEHEAEIFFIEKNDPLICAADCLTARFVV